MYRKEIYHVLMQEFADFCKIRVDVRYWLIPSVNTGANAGRRGQYRSSSQPVPSSPKNTNTVPSSSAGIAKWSVGVNGNISARHADDAGSSPVRSSITQMVLSASGQDTDL